MFMRNLALGIPTGERERGMQRRVVSVRQVSTKGPSVGEVGQTQERRVHKPFAPSMSRISGSRLYIPKHPDQSWVGRARKLRAPTRKT